MFIETRIKNEGVAFYLDPKGTYQRGQTPMFQPSKCLILDRLRTIN